MSALSAKATTCAQAEMSRNGVGQPTTSSMAKLVGSRELVKTKIAVDLIDIAQGFTRSSKTWHRLEDLSERPFRKYFNT